jgi:hypothetical protein
MHQVATIVCSKIAAACNVAGSNTTQQPAQVMPRVPRSTLVKGCWVSCTQPATREGDKARHSQQLALQSSNKLHVGPYCQCALQPIKEPTVIDLQHTISYRTYSFHPAQLPNTFVHTGTHAKHLQCSAAAASCMQAVSRAEAALNTSQCAGSCGCLFLNTPRSALQNQESTVTLHMTSTTQLATFQLRSLFPCRLSNHQCRSSALR